jgi:hypothetical protein
MRVVVCVRVAVGGTYDTDDEKPLGHGIKRHKVSCAEARKLWRMGPYIPMPERCMVDGHLGVWGNGRLVEKDGKAVGIAVKVSKQVGQPQHLATLHCGSLLLGTRMVRSHIVYLSVA